MKFINIAATLLFAGNYVSAYDLYTRSELAVREALDAAHEIAMRSDPDIFHEALTSLAKRGCVTGGRGACIRGKCSTSGYFCHPNGCACD